MQSLRYLYYLFICDAIPQYVFKRFRLENVSNENEVKIRNNANFYLSFYK